MSEVFDIVIVGAGVVGGILASKLNERARILILEAGEEGPSRLDLVKAYVSAPKKSMGSPYRGRDGDHFAPSPDDATDYYVQPGQDKFKATYQRRYGGATWHWRGNVPRLIPSDFRMKSNFGVGIDWPLSYDDLEPWYVQAEAELGVSGNHDEWANYLGGWRSAPYPMSQIWPCYGDTILKPLLDGIVIHEREVRIMSTPQARNSQPYDGRPPCAGNSTCDPICPIGAKYDATVHLDKARKAGVQIRSQSVVTRVHIGADGCATGVTYRTWDGADHEVFARVVVVAAHAIESAKLLLMSRTDVFPNGVANSSDQVGRNLMDHLQGQGAALLPFPVYPFRGPPTTSGIDAFRDGHFRAHGAAFRMSVGNDGWGLLQGPYATALNLIKHERLFGDALRERTRDVLTRQFRLSYSTETLPDADNRVVLSSELDRLGVPRPELRFQLSDYNRRGFAMGRSVIRTLFEKLGATDITIPADDRYSAANHIMGTCRMGTDPTSSVVDVDSRAHDHRNLFIVGGSAFPTCGTANPTLTVAALALRAVPAIARELEV
ncbi:GMC family oxidoreductase [Piscinibacter sp. HJYY11]|uniref:GMC family oxidoreductase n=1 Tax=Piscinibacter sp. HJYY11 TaxID=2801333 RepID=UPI00191D37A6|nr:GMC family oxidoreductase [Piscinibacter sp. HJYY11]MBL0726110.1 GMC family oxidoreductase [Piscinibacter sp. HJYY11]